MMRVPTRIDGESEIVPAQAYPGPYLRQAPEDQSQWQLCIWIDDNYYTIPLARTSIQRLAIDSVTALAMLANGKTY